MRSVVYNDFAMANISSGTAHTVPSDLRSALAADATALAAWNDLRPLSRNEWVCWVVSVKKDETRKEHIARLVTQLKEGKRRPCCWIGCVHRADKKVSPSVKAILERRSKKGR